MQRQILKPSLLREGTPPDDFKARLIKMIPGEVVAAYMACNTAIDQYVKSQDSISYVPYWVVFGIIIVLLPFYLKRVMNVTDTIQIILMTISFTIWCSTIDHPFDRLFNSAEGQKLWSTIALTIYTFSIPIFYKGK